MAPQAPQRSGGPGKAAAPLDIRDVREKFVPVTTVSELAPGAMKWVAVYGARLLIVNVDGAFYALQDACGHRQAPLSKGTLEGHVIECPLHFAQFDVRTGKLLSGPTATDVRTYEVLVHEDTVYVKR